MELSKLLFGGDAASPGRGCLQCGRCCDAFGGHLQATRGDLERWRRLGREDLLARVSPAGFLWIQPETGHIETACPFLRRTGPDRATCEINDVKPDTCRDFPTLAHGRRCLRGVFLSWAGLVAADLPALLALGLA
jgi:Fe-S-cluster containining protein